MRAQWGLFTFAVGVTTLALAAPMFQPARFLSGAVPQPPPQTTGWLDAVFHVQVTATGTVETVDRLRGAEPIAMLLHDHLKRWRFAPAREDGKPVNASVLVAAMYRPASLFNQPGVNEPPPVNVDRSALAPIPMLTPLIAYPPRAVGDGVVVLEILVTATGEVAEARVARSSGAAFDSSALRTGLRWQFYPAPPSAPRPTFAYLIFGFRQPVVTSR